VPNSEIQQALDTALERARDGAKAWFAKSLAELDTVPDATKPLPEGSAPAEDETAAVSRLTATPSSAIMSREVADAADGDPMGWLQVGYEATSMSRCASRSHSSSTDGVPGTARASTLPTARSSRHACHRNLTSYPKLTPNGWASRTYVSGAASTFSVI